MSKSIWRLALLSIVFGISGLQSYSQNIVTIFGQEKIEETEEGQVFYRFKDGYLLPGGTNPGVLFNGQDMIGWLYASDNFETPKDGAEIGYSYVNMDNQVEDEYLTWLAKSNGERGMERLPIWTWTAIHADSLGVFKRPEMRSAFLYTAYDSPEDEIVLLEATGGTRTYVNGLPHEGDHYDFGYTLTPIKLKKGTNEFVYTPGRFGKIESKLVKPTRSIMLTKRDMTTPDLIIEEKDSKWAAIRVINATEKALKGLIIRATLPDGKQETSKADEVMPLNVRKLKYRLPAYSVSARQENIPVNIELLNAAGQVLDQLEIELRQVSSSETHERTFVSKIDGSVQYYSITPAIRESASDQKAMVLTVHGAGVEARNQARAYKSKDWTDIVAATNRRPYGFNWEEWGRIDALEVLDDAKNLLNPDESKIYLTGHSMGGHGTWFLGTTYPDKFAAIAPCAGYPDIAGYSRGVGDNMHLVAPNFEAFKRSANGGRVKSLVQNLKQSGVYIFHGDADSVVSPDQARQMRNLLGQFHPDFCYYEYPEGEHWFGDESVDWYPIFDFFKRHSIPEDKEINKIDFYTASPAISPKDYWVRVEQQEKPYEITNVQADIVNDTIKITTAQNAALLVLDIPTLKVENEVITLDMLGEYMNIPTNQKVFLKKVNDKWKIVDGINVLEKYSGRYGGFKNAFDHNVVFVYGTKGTNSENEWNLNKARFDAETFYYRANGSIEVIADTEYSVNKYPDRNVIIYGNKDNNAAWNTLLKDSKIQVGRKSVKIDNKTLTGEDLGIYFIYPHPKSNVASVGVVSGTGEKGMKGTSPNNYFSGLTGFPDFLIFRNDMLKDGTSAIEMVGFFDNDWTLSKKDYY